MSGELTAEQSLWLMKSVLHRNHTWQYENGVVNVQGDVHCCAIYYTSIIYSHFPVQFGTVTGDFRCYGLHLESLRGCPHEVGGYFHCNSNQLTSLQFCPEEINGDFHFNNNKITTLKYFPKRIDGKIHISSNQFELNNELFQFFAKINADERVPHFNYILRDEIMKQIPIQFGITDHKIISDILDSYIRIYDQERSKRIQSFT